MQVDWNERIAGLGMVEIRDLMKRMHRPVSPTEFAGMVPANSADALATELEARGWIERDKDGYLDPTLAGVSVGMAKKLKPLPRSEADRLLREVVTAANEINTDSRYSHNVARLAVFGSYLTDRETLNDLDIAYDLEARWARGSSESMEVVSARSNAAFPPPRSADWMGLLLWPERVVLRKLKVSRRVSLEEIGTIEQHDWPHRMLDLEER